MIHTRSRKGFTLVELLTVMAIIVILIGILTPALSAARTRATKTAVRAQINSLSVGLEAFRSDENRYVPSNAVLFAKDTMTPVPEMTQWEVGAVGELNGAHLLVDAMVGRDFLGYDPRIGSPNYDRWAVTNDRRDPYIPVDGVDVTSFDEPAEDADGVVPTPNITFPKPNGTEVEGVPVFRDKFGWPILYYRASATATQNTPIIQTPMADPFFGDGVYDGLDNALFTSYAMANHRIADANGTITDMCPGGYGTDDLSTIPNGGTFAEFIRSFRATTFVPMSTDIACPRPVKSDTFIILSAGRDGLYGTLDDVANFEVFSTER